VAGRCIIEAVKWIACVLALSAGCDLLVDIHHLPEVPADAGVDAPPPMRCSSITMLGGDFATQPLNFAWDASPGPNSIVQQNHAADLVSTVQGSYTSLQSFRFYDIRDSSFTIELVADGIDNDDNVLLQLESERAGYSVAFARTGGLLYFENTDASAAPEIVATLPYTDDMAYLRFAVSGTDVTWLTSPDGVVFTPRVTTANHGMTFVRVLIQTMVGEPSPPFTLHAAHANGDAPQGKACAISTLTDDFSAPMFADHWGRAAQANGVLDLAGQQARMTTTTGPPGASSVSVFLQASTVYDLTTGSITVEIPQMLGTSPSAVGTVALTIGTAQGDVMQMSQHAGKLTCSTDHAGNPANPAQLAYDAPTMRWWRIVHFGDSTTCETSSDGVTWAPPHATVTGLAGFDQVDVTVGATSTMQASESMLVDNVNLPP
jgi:hypothetical protein